MHANKVIGVHDGMDETVQSNGYVDISVIKDIGVKPIKEEDGQVMVHVQEGKLSPFLSQNDENSVPEIPNL